MNKTKGFTLVELSIVLVIIGLLIGGILVAQSMIRTVKIQRIVRDLQQYEIAVNNFKLNYKYYPGDSPSFTPPGDGNNMIAGLNVCNGIYSSYEPFQAFAHLSQAAMIKNNYTPLAPQSCGGTQNNDYYSSELAGIIAPYTEIDSESSIALSDSQGISGPKVSIFLRNEFSLNQNVYLYFYTSAKDVLPLEAKLGSAVLDNQESAIGLSNDYGVGNCDNSNDDPNISCSDTTQGSLFGLLRYYIGPV